MDPVSPDIAKKLLSRDFANLVGRVQKGGKLTRGERATNSAPGLNGILPF
jgi:hypothetical protein